MRVRVAEGSGQGLPLTRSLRSWATYEPEQGMASVVSTGLLLHLIEEIGEDGKG